MLLHVFNCLMHNNQREQFLLNIGTTQFYILELKYDSLSCITSSSSLTPLTAIRQNRILKGLFAVYNLLLSMSRKVGLLFPRPVVHYIFQAPVPIPQRPKLIYTISSKSVCILHQLRDSYLRHLKTQSNLRHLKRVHFYTYLLKKCINLLHLLLDIPSEQ